MTLAHSALQAEEEVFSPRSIEERMQIVLYELGALAKNLAYMKYSNVPERKRAYMADAFNEYGDLLVQLQMLHVQMVTRAQEIGSSHHPGWDECIQHGFDKQLERMKQFKEQGGT